MALKRYFPDGLFKILKALSENKNREVTVMDIPALAEVSEAFAIDILRDLSESGFVSLTPSIRDRRVKLVRLEEAGEILLEHLLIYRELLEGKISVYKSLRR